MKPVAPVTNVRGSGSGVVTTHEFDVPTCRSQGCATSRGAADREWPALWETSPSMTREDGWATVCEWIQNPNLRKHLLATEAAMRAYARRFGEDEESWGIVGLVHDLDYERCPSQEAGHPFVGVEELRRRGAPEAWCRAALSHASYSDIPRPPQMEQSLFAVDELV